jgi:hypothetical protein
MICHQRHHFLVVVEIAYLIQIDAVERSISWVILGSTMVQPSHWWCLALYRNTPYVISLVISYDQVGSLSVDTRELLVSFHIFGPLVYKSPFH